MQTNQIQQRLGIFEYKWERDGERKKSVINFYGQLKFILMGMQCLYSVCKMPTILTLLNVKWKRTIVIKIENATE